MTSRLSVYEALNHSRKEIFIGVTARPLIELIAVPRSWFPDEIVHWGATEHLAVRRVAEDLPPKDAWQFSSIYMGYIEREGWTVIRQKPAD